MRAGGILGGVAGLISAGVKCFASQDRDKLTAGDTARIFGRDVSAGAASGVAASAAALYVGAASGTVGAAVSAPAWIPTAAALAAAVGVGYVVHEGCQEIWSRCVGCGQEDCPTERASDRRV
jgi:hypothetical protein